MYSALYDNCRSASNSVNSFLHTIFPQNRTNSWHMLLALYLKRQVSNIISRKGLNPSHVRGDGSPMSEHAFKSCHDFLTWHIQIYNRLNLWDKSYTIIWYTCGTASIMNMAIQGRIQGQWPTNPHPPPIPLLINKMAINCF